MICRHTKHRYLHVQTHAQYPAYCAKSRAQYAMYLAHTRRYATHNERVFQMRVCSCALTTSQRTCMRACRAARTQPYTPFVQPERASQTQSAAHAQIALVDRVCTNERGAHPLENTRNSIAPSALATPAPRPTLHPQKAATYVKHAIAPDRACYSTSSPPRTAQPPLMQHPTPCLATATSPRTSTSPHTSAFVTAKSAHVRATLAHAHHSSLPFHPQSPSTGETYIFPYPPVYAFRYTRMG